MLKNHVDRNRFQEYRYRCTRLFVLESVAAIVASIGVMTGDIHPLVCIVWGFAAFMDYIRSESGSP